MMSATCLRLSLALCCVWTLVAAAETLARPALFAPGGLLDWETERLRRPRLARWLERCGMRPVFGSAGVHRLAWLRVWLALCVAVLLLTDRAGALPLLALVLATLLAGLQAPEESDGAGRFVRMTLVAASLATLAGTERAQVLALVFTAAQSALAYSTSGWLKASRRGWWSGAYMLRILSTRFAGDRCLYSLLRARPQLAVCAGGAVVVTDCLLGVAALLPPPLCACVLGLGVGMHLVLARVLGLNRFVWGFAAGYPAVWFVSQSLYRR